MGIIESGAELYYSIMKTTFLVCFVFFLFYKMYPFIDLSHLKFPISPDDFNVNDINASIDALKNSKGLDVIVSFGMLLISIFAMIITAFINSILLVNYAISTFIEIGLKILIIDLETATILSNILSWIILAPAIVGLFADMARLIFYTFFKR